MEDAGHVAAQIQQEKQRILEAVVTVALLRQRQFDIGLPCADIAAAAVVVVPGDRAVHEEVHQAVRAQLQARMLVFKLLPLPLDKAALCLLCAAQMVGNGLLGHFGDVEGCQGRCGLLQHLFLGGIDKLAVGIPAAQVRPFAGAAIQVGLFLGERADGAARMAAGQQPPEDEFLVAVFERLFLPACQHRCALLEQLARHDRGVAVRVRLALDNHNAAIKGVGQDQVDVGAVQLAAALGFIPQAPAGDGFAHMLQRVGARGEFLEHPADQRRAQLVDNDGGLAALVAHVQVADRRDARQHAFAQHVVLRPPDVIAQAVGIALRHDDAERPHHALLADAALVDDVVFSVEVQLEPAFLNEAVEQRVFLKAALHAVDLVGDKRDRLFLRLDVGDHLHELRAVAACGRLGDLE